MAYVEVSLFSLAARENLPKEEMAYVIDYIRRTFPYRSSDHFYRSSSDYLVIHTAKERLTRKQEAYLIALVCSQAPEGFARWTLRLLANQLVELGDVEAVSHETVRQVLLTNELKPWIKKQWCIPTPADADFVYHMEDVLEVYTRPYDPARPQVCMEELESVRSLRSSPS